MHGEGVTVTCDLSEGPLLRNQLTMSDLLKWRVIAVRATRRQRLLSCFCTKLKPPWCLGRIFFDLYSVLPVWVALGKR